MAELSLWRGMLERPALSVSAGAPDPVRDLIGSAGHVRLRLAAAVTGALLTRVAARFHGGINEVLLTGLALAVAELCGRRRAGPSQSESENESANQNESASENQSERARAAAAGPPAVLLELEGHGREELFGDLDLTRTVGWFTSVAPLRLELSGIDVADALAGGASLGRLLKRVKEALRALPGKGLGYGLLRYLNPETSGVLAGLPAPQLSFNYLGRFGAPGSGDWEFAAELAPSPAPSLAVTGCGLAAAIRRWRCRTRFRSTR